MTRYILLNRIEEPEKIKQFDGMLSDLMQNFPIIQNYIFVKS